MTSQIGGQTRLFANFDIRSTSEQPKGIRVHESLIGRIFYSLFSTTVRVNLEGGKSVVVNKNSLTKYLADNGVCSQADANALSKEDIRKLVGNCFSRASKAPAGEKKEQMVAEFRNIFRNIVKPESGKVRMATDEEGVLPSVFLQTKDLNKLGEQLTRQLGDYVSFDVTPQGMMLKALGQDIPISHSWSNPTRTGQSTFEISPPMLHALLGTFVEQNGEAANQKAGELSRSKDPDDRLIGNLLQQCIREKQHPDAEIAERLAEASRQELPAAPTASTGGPRPTEVCDEHSFAQLGTALVASDDNTGAFEGGVLIDRLKAPQLRTAFLMAGISPHIAQMFIGRGDQVERPISFTFREIVLLRELAQRAQSNMQQAIVRADSHESREMAKPSAISVGLPTLPSAPPSPPKSPVREERSPSPRPPSPHVQTPPAPGTPPRAQTPPRIPTPPGIPTGVTGTEGEAEVLTAEDQAQKIFDDHKALYKPTTRMSIGDFRTFVGGDLRLFEEDGATRMKPEDYATIVGYFRGASGNIKTNSNPDHEHSKLRNFLQTLPEDQKQVFNGLLDKIEENARTHQWITDMRKYLVTD